jgi:hypothetical protein
MKQKPSVWLQLYFVLATLIGLICLVFGVSSLVNTALTSTVLVVKSQHYNQPPMPPMADSKAWLNSDELTESQRQSLTMWEADYERWKVEQKDYDYEAENRKRSMASAIAMIITGIPVFALHAPKVFKQFGRES